MMHNRQKNGLVAGILLPMGLVCLFAFCSLALALLGGKAYKNIQQNVDNSFGSTVAASYLHTKLSQNNLEGAVEVRMIGDVQVLAIATNMGGKTYEMRIFMNEGYLVETFGAAKQPLNAVGASKIAPLASCTFVLDEKALLTARFVGENGEETSTAFALAKGGCL